MMQKDVYILNGYETEDFEDVLHLFLSHYKIELKNQDFVTIKNFKELVNHILHHTDYELINDCTSQQIFYKLKQSIHNNTEYSGEIAPSTPLIQIFPRKNRRKNIKAIEKDLDLKLNILEPQKWISGTLFALFICSVVLLFNHFFIGFVSLATTILLFMISIKFAKELKGETFRDFVEKIMTSHYSHFRKNNKSINKKEFEKVIYLWFSENMDISISKLEKIVFE